MTQTPHEGLLLGDWLSWSPESLIPSSSVRHIPLIGWIFAHVEPKLSVELGSGDGGSFRALCQIADRFGGGGRSVGIDPWKADLPGSWGVSTAYEALMDYCCTRHAGKASLMRMELNEAVGEFKDGTIDFLHIARTDGRLDSSPLDPEAWRAKMRSGGVVLVTSEEQGGDDSARKVWQQLSAWFPSAEVALPGLVGVVQVPDEGNAPLVELLRSEPAGVSSLFRSLGERVEYRHIIGSEPVSSAALRRYISNLMKEHADDAARIEAQHQVRREALERQVAAASEGSLARAQELNSLKSEIDLLMAKLAAQSSLHERQSAEIERNVANHVAEIEWKHSLAMNELHDRYVSETSRLHDEVVKREEHIQAVANTLSWRLTKPLRAVQTARTKLVPRAR